MPCQSVSLKQNDSYRKDIHEKLIFGIFNKIFDIQILVKIVQK